MHKPLLWYHPLCLLLWKQVSHTNNFCKSMCTHFGNVKEQLIKNLENMDVILWTHKNVPTITMATSLLVVTNKGSTTTSPHKSSICTTGEMLNASVPHYSACAGFHSPLFLTSNMPLFQTDASNFISDQERIRTGDWVRGCNYVKIETGRNFLPVLRIVTHTAEAA